MQYFFVDESGDAGLEGQASSSSHFVLAMVQLPERAFIQPLIDLRMALMVSPRFEFKYHISTPMQKDQFFQAILKIPFRVRVAVVDKSRLGAMFANLSPQELTIELLVRLTLRASELDIANEVLIIDGATSVLCRNVRIHFSERCKQEKRIRPFKNIIGGDSKREDGLQVADMVAGATRVHEVGVSSRHFHIISPHIVDLWKLP
jgi:hypothetical protein